MIRVRHSGGRGDLVYALPALKWLAEQRHDKILLCLAETAPFVTERMTPEKWVDMVALLVAQPYIGDVMNYDGGPVDVNMDDFRLNLFSRHRKPGSGSIRRLSDWQRDIVGAPMSCQDSPWLTVTPRHHARFVVNRTKRYNNPEFPWTRIGAAIAAADGLAVFVGTEEEHAAYVSIARWIPHYQTMTLLDAAEVIAGADCFIGNQSVCYAIAEGLKKPALLEVCPQMPNCLFFRSGVSHGWDHSCQLPVDAGSAATVPR